MDFIIWHYSDGINYYLYKWVDKLETVYYSFSPWLLFKTLFAPWKRLVIADKKPGFDFKREFEKLTFNLISRAIGAVVRAVLIIVSMLLLFALLVGGVLGLLFWVLFPPISFIPYRKKQLSLENYIANLLNHAQVDGKIDFQKIFSSEAGKFVADHLGLSQNQIIGSLGTADLKVDRGINSFERLIKKLVEAEAWPQEFYETNDLAPYDLVAAASWWDETRREISGENEKGSKTYPGLALDLIYGYTPTLDKVSTDLSTPQEFYHRLIGREEIVKKMERIVESGQSVLLLGQPGVGKKTVVLEFAHRARVGLLGKRMQYKKVYELDYNDLLSGTLDLNAKKAKFSMALSEASSAGNIILMVRDIHRITNREVEGYDFTDILENELGKGKLEIIAVGTESDYERFISSNLRLRKHLKEVTVEPPSKDEAFEILIDLSKRYEKEKGLTITIPVLRKILNESDRYITDTPFPEKALELLEAVVSYRQQEGGSKVSLDDANEVLRQKTGISFAKIGDSEKTRLTKIEDIIHRRLVNQESAVGLIGKTLRARAVQVKKEERPIGSFLFLGPTGVGKTETAKTLAEVYYGDENNMIRFDMAEFSGSEGLERLIGSVSKNQPGELTTAIKNKPASLLLLDEFEKATPQVFNLFLTLLDEGTIKDASGRVVIGKHLFVIATSNAGSEFIRQAVSQGIIGDELQKSVVNHVLEAGIFTPEFLNRFDGVVVYEPLGNNELYQIAKLMLGKLSEEFRIKNNIHLEVTDEAAQKLSEDGYEPAFGARPMRRIIEIEIGDLLGRALLSGDIKAGERIKLLPGNGINDFYWERPAS